MTYINSFIWDCLFSQDSPVFNYISNLSPIQPVKAGPVSQGFPELASPPLVFTSPRITSLHSFGNSVYLFASEKFSQDHDNCQRNERDLGHSMKVVPEFRSPLVPSDQKTCNTEKLVSVAHCSPSGCFDDYLGDPGQSANFTHKMQSDNAPPSAKGGCLKKIGVVDGRDMGPFCSASQKGRDSAQPRSRISVKLVKNESRHMTSLSECSGALPRLLTDHISQSGDSFSEGFCLEHSKRRDSDKGEGIEEMLCLFRGMRIRGGIGIKASQLERGTLRRCLFDESQRKNSADQFGFSNPIVNAQIQESANMSYGKSGNRHMINLSKPAIDASVSPGNYPVVISKSLGIGLHLNSVVYSGSTDSAIGSQQSSMVSVEGNSSPQITNNQSDGKINASNIVGISSASREEIDQHQAHLVPAYDTTIAPDLDEQFNTAIDAKLDPCSTITNDKRKSSPDLDENDSSLGSPKKTRQASNCLTKKASTSTDDDTTKRCNCKKTKCLKLYCDCFAAGFYCGESCACQGCFNRPEYEDTVLETRQQIESRNPLAFAPKVMQTVTASPTTGKVVEKLSTPSSARHKRGCNCKKSMCLKKYCECYQANVGCSEGCRCEGCKNIYGVREGAYTYISKSETCTFSTNYMHIQFKSWKTTLDNLSFRNWSTVGCSRPGGVY
uniref:Fgenesh protein 45 n=1 Tax=Beta vulgaris TaxID=161934 RepID=Q20CD7_BETVU|nr:Fgenesh protein 45 [Beta vulgaris]